MDKEWKIRGQTDGGIEEQLLSVRKIDDKNSFFSPDYERDLYGPFELLNMDKAVDRILGAIKKNEKVIVFGDYDADGVCSSSIFHDFFKKIGFENFETYIPDRNTEGFSLTLGVIEKFSKDNVDLIVTLDCGVTDYDEVRKANEQGMDVVILDHHLQAEKLPQAVAIVDPKQEKDDYPFEMLCGAAVAFKTIQALIDKGGFNITPGWEKWLLDLVAVATVADMVPLCDENRVLLHYGLRVLKKTNRVGFLALFKKLKINQKNVTEDDIAFLIAPRVNIASRMEHASISYSLLTTESSEESKWVVGRLDDLNKERRSVVEGILDEVEKRIKTRNGKPEIIIEGDLLWRPGVLGLSANRIMEKHNCPVFLYGEGSKGSARGIGVNLVKLMSSLPEGILLESGGHALAAGFTLREGGVEEFKEELFKAFKKVKKEKIENILWIDKELELSEVSWSFLETVEKFSPFGMGNEKPVFLFKGVEIYNVKMFGNGGLHLQLDFVSGNGVISAIGFFMSNGDLNIKKGNKIDLVAAVERNTFGGKNEIRLRIIDLRIKI